MDLAKDLRAAQAAFDTADAALAESRATFDGAARAYDHARRHRPSDVDRARQAWAVAAMSWVQALVARETAKDALAAERRRTDRDAETELAMPARSAP